LTSEEPILSDLRAIAASTGSISLQSLAMQTGLGVRTIADAVMHLTPFNNFTHINGVKGEYIDAQQKAYLDNIVSDWEFVPPSQPTSEN